MTKQPGDQQRVNAAAGLPAPYFDVAEDNGKPPLLMLHGFQMSRSIWDANIAGLSAVARPIRMDLFGQGLSPAPSDERCYDMAHYLACLEAERVRLGYSRWAICAHSLGASIGLFYALKHPAAVRAIVFTNSRSALSRPEEFAAAREEDGVAAQILAGGVEGLQKLPSHAVHMKHVVPEVKQALLADSVHMDPYGIVKTMSITAPQANVRDMIAGLQCPALLVNGVRERRFQPLRNWLQKQVPSIAIADMQAGHSPNAEMPAPFNAIVTAFLTDLNRA